MQDLIVVLGAAGYAARTGGGVIAGINDLNNLANGSLVVFEETGAIVDAIMPAPTAEKVYICLGRTVGGVYRSAVIDRDSLRWEKQDYVAPVAKIMYLGYDGATAGATNLTTVAGDYEDEEFTIDLLDPTVGVNDPKRVITRINYTATATDNDEDIIDGLVANWNANAEAAAMATAAKVGATGATLGIRFTGVTVGVDFNLTFRGPIEVSTRVEYLLINGAYSAASLTAVACNKGRGTAAEVLVLETRYAADQGKNDTAGVTPGMWTVPSRVVAGATYTYFNLSWVMDRGDTPSQKSHNNTQELIIAVPDADAVETALDTILAAL